MTPGTIDIESLSVRFDDRTILAGVDLHLPAGDRVSLTGPSGSGKSTILRCLLGFVEPAGGTVRIDGEAVDGDSIWRLRRRMAYVAQEAQLGHGPVRDVLARPLSYRANCERRDNVRRAPELFEHFRLPLALLDEPIDTLSGGEKQRVALTAALLLDRPILLLDEASSALDKESRRAVADYLRAADRYTILSISHDPEEFDLGGRTVSMPAGGGSA